jgi:hypothetical protein
VSTAAENPRCTDFCRGSRGHYDVSQAEIDVMRAALLSGNVPPPDSVDFLYRLGYGYHAVADALGISHEQGYMVLTGQAGIGAEGPHRDGEGAR